MTKRNMKIKVENNLNEIVGELERLGYKLLGVKYDFKCLFFVIATVNGYYITLINPPSYCDLTTLAELKEM